MKEEGKSTKLKPPVIATIWLTGRADPQRRFNRAANWGPIGMWVNSVKLHGLNGILFHDNIPDEIINEHTTESFTFVKVTDFTEQPYNVIDYRWILYADYFAKNKHEKIFVTDCQDVKVLQSFMKKVEPSYIYTCAERTWTQNPTINKSKWTKLLIDHYYSDFQYYKNPLLNAGIFGAYYDLFMQTVTAFAKEIKRLDPKYPTALPKYVDMAVYNQILYSMYDLKEIRYGFPIHTGFGKLAGWRKDCWMAHK